MSSMGKIYAKAVANRTRTLASIGEMWFEATWTALMDMVQDGKVSETRLTEILTQAAADGLILPEESQPAAG